MASVGRPDNQMQGPKPKSSRYDWPIDPPEVRARIVDMYRPKDREGYISPYRSRNPVETSRIRVYKAKRGSP